MLKILIVDDEPRILLLLQSLLKANGYSVETARDGNAALDIVRKGGVDIAVTDLRMAPMDGMSLFREIKAIAPTGRRADFQVGHHGCQARASGKIPL